MCSAAVAVYKAHPPRVRGSRFTETHRPWWNSGSTPRVRGGPGRSLWYWAILAVQPPRVRGGLSDPLARPGSVAVQPPRAGAHVTGSWTPVIIEGFNPARAGHTRRRRPRRSGATRFTPARAGATDRAGRSAGADRVVAPDPHVAPGRIGREPGALTPRPCLPWCRTVQAASTSHEVRSATGLAPNGDPAAARFASSGRDTVPGRTTAKQSKGTTDDESGVRPRRERDDPGAAEGPKPIQLRQTSGTCRSSTTTAPAASTRTPGRRSPSTTHCSKPCARENAGRR